MPPFRIIIIGGGVSGLAAAIGLQRKGHHVTVLESTPTLQTLGGSLLIPPNAARVLDSYGIWQKFLESERIPVGNTTFRWEDGSLLEEVSYGAMQGAFGYPVIAIPRAEYQRLLYEAAVELGVEVRLSSRIKNTDETTPSVTMESGVTIEGDIIIGADGIKSTARKAIVGDHDVQPIPESIAYQCNISGDDMRNDSLTAPLMHGGAIHNILAANSSNSYRKGSVEAMRKCVSMFEPRVRKFVSMVKSEDCFLWKIAHLPPLSSWVSKSGKVTLLGDAAHAMVPHLGAGAASAVEDGAILTECIGRAKSSSNIPAALQAYEKIRRPRSERIQATALVTGQYKVMADGLKQRERDEKMRQRMDKRNPKYDYWKSGGGLEWLYGYDFLKEANAELDRLAIGFNNGSKL